MNKYKIVFLSLLAAISFESNAQLWQYNIDPPDPYIDQTSFTLSCIANDNEDRLVVAGWTHEANDQYRIVIFRINPMDGSVLGILGGPPVVRLLTLVDQNVPPIVRDLLVDSQGKLVLCGQRDPTPLGILSNGNPAPPDEHAFIIKYDFDIDNVEWTWYHSTQPENVIFYDLIEYPNYGDYLVCGEFDDGLVAGTQEEDAILYHVDRTLGTLTLLRRNAWQAGDWSDTYNAMYLDDKNNVFLTGRFEYFGSTADQFMRPMFVKCDLGLHSCNFGTWYLENVGIGYVARFYSWDIARNGDRFLIPVTGDLDGTATANMHDDMVLLTSAVSPLQSHAGSAGHCGG